MQTLVKKIKLIYLPFLVIAINFVILYTLLDWILFIRTNSFPIRQDIIYYWLPIGLSWIPILIWLRPRIKLLDLKTKKGSQRFLYQFIASLALIIPTIVAQGYVEKAAGKLTQLENIGQIVKQEPTKYYTLKYCFIDKKNIGVHPIFDVSGKNSENFNMNIYLALPILIESQDTNKTNCLAWLGIKYHKQINNRLEQDEKEKSYKEFANNCQLDFDKRNLNEFIYLETIANTVNKAGYLEAIKQNKKYNTNNLNILIPINEPFEARLGNIFNWIFGSFGIVCGIWLIMILWANFDENEVNLFESGKPSSENEMKDFINFFKPREGYFITPILIYLNIAIFILMVIAGMGFISFKGSDLLNWGANYRPLTANGEWWRLLTSTFLHGGVMHVFANMYGLMFIGIFLEPALGRKKYLIIYLLTGILASCASLWWHEETVSVGASGAIFGLYGLFLAMLLTKIFPKEFSKAFLTSILIFIGYNLLMGIGGGIDNAAHIGGLISGFIIGLILYPTLKNKTENELNESNAANIK